MKRYLVFFGSYYYPRGGMEDFEGDFETMEECNKRIDELLVEEYMKYDYWAHIFDTQTKETLTVILDK